MHACLQRFVFIVFCSLLCNQLCAPIWRNSPEKSTLLLLNDFCISSVQHNMPSLEALGTCPPPPSLRSFPNTAFETTAGPVDDGSFSSFQERQPNASSFYLSLLREVDGVTSLDSGWPGFLMQERQCRSYNAGATMQEWQCRSDNAGATMQELQCMSYNAGATKHWPLYILISTVT